MNLKHVTNNDLIAKAKHFSSEERRLTSELLHTLAEIDKRRLFAIYGYKSLFEFVTKELHYSDGAAFRSYV